MRIIPDSKYVGKPCSYVGTGCAYEDYYRQSFSESMIPNLKEDGWATLENANKYIRNVLPIKKKVYYKRDERITLEKFLKTNNTRCIVCVYGHFVYVNGENYWSFFENEKDKVVCVWYIS